MPAAAEAAPAELEHIAVLYGSAAGTCKGYAQTLGDLIRKSLQQHRPAAEAAKIQVSVQPMDDFEPEELKRAQLLVWVVASYQHGQPPVNAQFMHDWLSEAVVDWRVERDELAGCRYAVLGAGDSLYEENFNLVAKHIERCLLRLQAERLCPSGVLDANIARDGLGTQASDFQEWSEQRFLPALARWIKGEAASPADLEESPLDAELREELAAKAQEAADDVGDSSLRGSGDDAEFSDDDEDEDEDVDDSHAEEAASSSSRADLPLGDAEVPEFSDPSSEGELNFESDEDAILAPGELELRRQRQAERRAAAAAKGQARKAGGKRKGGKAGAAASASSSSSMVDLEDLGNSMAKSREQSEAQRLVKELAASNETITARPMLNDSLRQNLTKQGYKLIGTHSGVKLCRWTKAMLRGRGGCYKHTFYGIESYNCMEMTPSLACQDRCVFCWRSHTNPVSREWRWKVDEPELIVQQALQKHRDMIKVMKGVPGVKPERLQEAFKVKHCALSLVGEPIMYPHINRVLELLHREHVSSFLVTNARLPEKIRDLGPCTQLYVSVDAATQEALKAVDRPLLKDFWPRYLSCLDLLHQKQMTRTVFRLTLVRDYNMDDLPDYAKLVRRGRPTFIEIKGVTFCGDNETAGLNMGHVPFHQEVRAFGQALVDYLQPEYHLVCEHAHSCSVLIVHESMRRAEDNRWMTWIDYDRFYELAMRFYETGETFSAQDYWAPTPDWAFFGSEEAGFDPEERRHFRRNRRGSPEEQAALRSQAETPKVSLPRTAVDEAKDAGQEEDDQDPAAEPEEVISGGGCGSKPDDGDEELPEGSFMSLTKAGRRARAQISVEAADS